MRDNQHGKHNAGGNDIGPHENLLRENTLRIPEAVVSVALFRARPRYYRLFTTLETIAGDCGG